MYWLQSGRHGAAIALLSLFCALGQPRVAWSGPGALLQRLPAKQRDRIARWLSELAYGLQRWSRTVATDEARLAPGLPNAPQQLHDVREKPFLAAALSAVHELGLATRLLQGGGTVSALADEFGLNPKTLATVLGFLQSQHMVRQDPQTGVFVAGDEYQMLIRYGVLAGWALSYDQAIRSEPMVEILKTGGRIHVSNSHLNVNASERQNRSFHNEGHPSAIWAFGDSGAEFYFEAGGGNGQGFVDRLKILATQGIDTDKIRWINVDPFEGARQASRDALTRAGIPARIVEDPQAAAAAIAERSHRAIIMNGDLTKPGEIRLMLEQAGIDPRKVFAVDGFVTEEIAHTAQQLLPWLEERVLALSPVAGLSIHFTASVPWAVLAKQDINLTPQRLTEYLHQITGQVTHPFDFLAEQLNGSKRIRVLHQKGHTPVVDPDDGKTYFGHASFHLVSADAAERMDMEQYHRVRAAYDTSTHAGTGQPARGRRRFLPSLARYAARD